MDTIIAIDIRILITMVMIVSIQCVGIVQWLKSFSKCVSKRKGCSECRACKKRSKYAIWAFIVLVPCAIMNTTLVHPLATAVFDIVFLSLSVEQMAYQAITNGVPNLVNSLFNKAAEMQSLNSVANTEREAR
jgi:hypothetical protein